MSTTEAVATRRPHQFVIWMTSLAVIAGAMVAVAIVIWISSGFSLADIAAWTPIPPIAIVSALVMAAACKTWRSWRRWIWVALVITMGASAATTWTTVQNFRAELHAQQCSDHLAYLNQLTPELASLVAEAQEIASGGWREALFKWQPAPPTQSGQDWSGFDTGPFPNAEADAWEHYTAGGGPALEAEIARVKYLLAIECD